MSKGKKRFGHKHKPKAPSKFDKRKDQLTPGRNSRRETKLVRESVDEVEDEVNDRLNGTELSNPPTRRGDDGRLLLDPKSTYKDIKLIQSILKKGYNVRRKTMLRRRLEEIAAKKEADVITKDGIVNLESAGDKLAIEATKALILMDQTDMKRIELADKLDKDEENKPQQSIVIHDNSSTTNNNIIATPDDRRASLIRLAERIGAREISIDGESIKPGEVPGTALPLPKS